MILHRAIVQRGKLLDHLTLGIKQIKGEELGLFPLRMISLALLTPLFPTPLGTALAQATPIDANHQRLPPQLLAP